MPSKDPAFLFYPSDFLTGVAGLTMEERGQYITLLCLQHQSGGLTEKTIRLTVGSVSVDVLSKFHLCENGLYTNKRLEVEVQKRIQFVESRRVNGKKGGRPSKSLGYPVGYPNGKPSENLVRDINIDSIIKEIEELNSIVVKAEEKQFYMFLIVEMSKVFKEKNPEYPFSQTEDFHACLDIAYNIAELKNWTKHEVVNGKMNECLESWRVIVDFIKEDGWLNTRSLSDISSVKEWQRLVMKMNAVKKEKKKKSIIV